MNYFPQPLASARRLRPRLRGYLSATAIFLLLAVVTPLYSQTAAKTPSKKSNPASASKVAAIKSFRIIQEKDGQAVEILSTKPLVPSVQQITDPDRLVIDLPNAIVEPQEKKHIVQADHIKAIRADQFQQNPPVARVVVDLLAPRVYNWDAAGNRIVVHLGKNPVTNSSPFQAPTVVSLTSPLQRPLVTGVRSRGPLSLASDEGSVGSAFSAGADTAILRLSSGGEVHVCPGTTVAITPSQTRHNLMLSMNTGALEAHFSLDASSDSVMTPDFRILLVGPGEFHYAFSADPQGNTCVRALPGNTASAIVSELIGDRTYQVKATDQLLFRSGQLDRVDLAVPLECGCPPAREPQLRAENIPPKEIENIAQRPTSTATPANDSRRAASAAAPQPAGVSANPNEGDPKEIHVQIEAPFVFHAKGPAPAPVADVAALPLESRPAPAAPSAPLPPPSADPAAKTAADQPASANPPPQHGFFKKLGGFFSSLFH